MDWMLLLAFAALLVALYWWNQKRLRRPRERWKQFFDARRKDDDA